MLKTYFTMALLIGSVSHSSVMAQKGKQNKAIYNKPEVKFLEDIVIEINPESSAEKNVKFASDKQKKVSNPAAIAGNDYYPENASALQLKYAQLLNTRASSIQNMRLYSLIDEWYGTRYQLGGSTKDGVDCSAFVQSVYSGCYGFALPRTAKEQYDIALPVTSNELKEGDLVFFNTQGGVSHVGIYLQNNKFVHAATTSGVMVSDLFEAYWSKRFISAGRLPMVADSTAFVSAP